MKTYLSISIVINFVLAILLFKSATSLTNDKNTLETEKTSRCFTDLSNKGGHKTIQRIIQKFDNDLKPEDHCFECPDLNTFFSAHGIKQISFDEIETMLTEHLQDSDYNYSDKQVEEFNNYDQDEIFNSAIEVGEQMLYSETKEEAINNMIKLQFLTNMLSDEDKREINEHLKNK